MYDYLVVGAGLSGATCAQKLHESGKKVLVIDKRSHIGGNAYTEEKNGIHVHKYGAHIFHTNNKEVWDYITNFGVFNDFCHMPVANYRGEIFALPFNMNTFTKMWNIHTPEEARKIIEEQGKEITNAPKNLEEKAISLVGRDVYEKLIKGYTEKQWGRPCSELPTFIIERIPVRYSFDNNYFNDKYQGIPAEGYTPIVEKMLEGIEVHLDERYIPGKYAAEKIIYSGPMDEYYGYRYGELEYRTVRFEDEHLEGDFQGNAVVNYTDSESPWTRIIEHKHFEKKSNFPHTIISKEFSAEWKPGDEPYYPINNEKNNLIFSKYEKLSQKEKNVIFVGRLGRYRYYNMDQVIAEMISLCKELPK